MIGAAHAGGRLELRLAGAARADARARGARGASTCAQARQGVLELRQLDLEPALGAGRVLGEDVEDQLGAVDDPRRERVLEGALLGRIELVVDNQDVRFAVCSVVAS